MRAFPWCSILALALPGLLAAQAAPDPTADALLAQLVGRWRMAGEVRGRPVMYDLVVQRTLAGRYVELHMRDTARVPQYEARVFLGADTVRAGVLVHWLDSFGAAYSVPTGAGQVRGDTLEFTVPYPDGPFRDTFVFDRRQRRWMFRLESGARDGTWKLFARYDVRPVEKRSR